MSEGHFRRTRMIGMSQLVIAMMLAGSSVVAGKFLTGTLPVFLISFSSLLVAFGVMVPTGLRRWKQITELTGSQWVALFMQALCGIVLFRVFTLYGLKMTGAAEAGIILGTTPAVLTALAALILKERPTGYGLIGAGLAAAGMMILNLSGNLSGQGGTLPGGLLVFAAVVSEALFTVFRKKVVHTVPADTNTLVLIFISLILLFPFAAWDIASVSSVPDWPAFAAIAYYGVFATVIAYLLWTGGVGKVSASAAGAATAAMPLSAVILAAVFLREPLSPSQIGGCIMVISGIAASTLFHRQQLISPVSSSPSDEPAA